MLTIPQSSVADPGSRIPDLGSRILIFTHPGFRIQKQQQKRGTRKEKLVVITFYVATKFTKVLIILVLKWWRKKSGPIPIEL